MVYMASFLQFKNTRKSPLKSPLFLIPCRQPLLTWWSPVGVGDAPYLHISTSPGGLLLWSQLHVTPSQLKLDWKAGPKRLERGVTAGVREGQRKLGRRKKKDGLEKKLKRRPCREEERYKGRPDARCNVNS